MRCGSGSRAGGVEIEAVDDVAAVGRQGDAVLRLGVGRARLGELAGEPPELDHRAGGAEGQHHRHLQQHLEGVADVVGVELGEALGAVAALQQEGLAGGDIGRAAPSVAAPRRRRPAAGSGAGSPRRGRAQPRRHSRAPAGSAGRASCAGTSRCRHDISFPQRTAGTRGRIRHATPPRLEPAPRSATFGSARAMKQKSRLGRAASVNAC